MAKPSRQPLIARGESVLEEALRASERSAAGRLRGLRSAALPIGQSALAAAAAWLIASVLIGHPQPVQAPVAAVIVLGLVLGQRLRRAVGVTLGVATGIAVATLLISAVGTGPLRIALVVIAAMVAAVALGGGPILVTQASVAAISVAAVGAADDPFGLVLDSFIGAVVGLVVNLAFPVNPLKVIRRAVPPVIDELIGTLGDIAAALEAKDLEAARWALARARAVDEPTGRLHEALEVARETARLAPSRWRSRGRLTLYAGAVPQLDLAERGVRSIARAAFRLVAAGDPSPPELADALRELGEAFRGVRGELEADESGRRGQEAALRAVAESARAFDAEGNISVSVLVGLVRTTAVDLLRSLGMEAEAAGRAVAEAARAPAE